MVGPQLNGTDLKLAEKHGLEISSNAIWQETTKQQWE